MLTLVSGTNRPGARTLAIAHYYGKRYQDRYQQPYQVIDLSELPAEYLSGQYFGKGREHPDFVRLMAQMTAEPGPIVWLFPEYNNSFPGVLKSFLDTMPYPNPLKGRVTGMVAISAGTNGGANALTHWADILQFLGLWVVPQRVRLFSINQNWVNDRLASPAFDLLIDEQLGQLVTLSEAIQMSTVGDPSV